MITLTNLSKNYGKKILFENISLTINPGEKIGLIGPNGAGKSTLFSLILKETEPSSGSIQVVKNIHIGYLPQESGFKSSSTVLGELVEGDARIMRLVKEKEGLENKNEAGSSRYGDVLHQLEALSFFELEHKAKKILSGLGFKERDFNRLVSQMSGGWQMRVLLAKLLTYQYDLLLLDEPTNYLDLNAALWLKDYLTGYDGAFIMISHDRAFLTDVTNYTFILDGGNVTKVRGNYEHYERIKEERRVHLERQFKEQEKKREQLEKFVSRFHAQPNKAASVRAKRRVLERIDEDEVELPQDTRRSAKDFSFPPTRKSGHKVMSLEKISKSYKLEGSGWASDSPTHGADIQVYKDIDFEITQGEKAVLAGENGAGKSTLLKILAGVVDIDSGSRVVGHNVDAGYFSQTRLDVLNENNTVLQEAYSAAPGFMSEELIRSIMGAFLFTGDDAEKKVKVLSGGEKSRLILAKLLIKPPNFLLLDEPTTHLDVDSVDALVRALKGYEGTLVFISHDIYFVRSVANVVFEVKEGSIRKFHGDFDYYLEKKHEKQFEEKQGKKAHFKVRVDNVWVGQSEAQPLPSGLKEKAKRQELTRKEGEKSRKAHNVLLREKINSLIKEKEKLGFESNAKVRALSDPDFYRDEEIARDCGRRLKAIEKRLLEVEVEIKELEARMIV